MATERGGGAVPPATGMKVMGTMETPIPVSFATAKPGGAAVAAATRA